MLYQRFIPPEEERGKIQQDMLQQLGNSSKIKRRRRRYCEKKKIERKEQERERERMVTSPFTDCIKGDKRSSKVQFYKRCCSNGEKIIILFHSFRFSLYGTLSNWFLRYIYALNHVAVWNVAEQQYRNLNNYLHYYFFLLFFRFLLVAVIALLFLLLLGDKNGKR